MGKWLYQLDFGDFYNDDNISIKEKGVLVASEIKKMPFRELDCFCGDDLEDHIEYFECVENVNEFDEYMNSLYDMADKYRIWINTYKKR